MRRTAIVLLLVLGAIPAAAQPARQTARQALLEMFFGQPGSFEKHLPKVTLAALNQVNGGTSQLAMFSMIASQMSKQGSLQTFDAGSTLVAVEDPKAHTKFEINLEKDDLRGNEDEIEVSFRAEKDGVVQDSHMSPRLTFLMKSEAGVWKMYDISFRITVPLADPEFLKSVVDNLKQRQNMMTAAATPPPAPNVYTTSGAPIQPANENGAINSLRTIVTAEVTYATTYPARGYTCFLSDLDGFGQGSPNEHQAMLIESRLASGKKNGYVFTVSGCGSDPVMHFQIVAVPASGQGRAFCSDESAVIRFASNGNGEACLHTGRPLQ